MQTHKKLKEVLYSIIAVCFIVWAIVYVQLRSTPVAENISPPPPKTNQLTSEQRAQIVSSLQETQATTPQLTKTQRDKVLQDLRKQIANQQ